LVFLFQKDCRVLFIYKIKRLWSWQPSPIDGI
jgi:hypothetical protein